MSIANQPTPAAPAVKTERHFARFALGQRWEHLLLIVSFTVLLLTGLPQKYRAADWSQQILSTPERLTLVQTIHHIAAVVLLVEIVYHLARNLWLLARRRLSGAMFPNWQDVRDAGQMFKYLFFLSKQKPAFGKYNFEQKFTYWFLFFGLGLMAVTGLLLWFPVFFTRFLPGDIIPAAKLAHGAEAVGAAIFVLIWHFYHVHIERLNLSIFTGQLNEADMRAFHAGEYQRLAGRTPPTTHEGDKA